MTKLFQKQVLNYDDNNGGNIFWITMSDLLLGLAIVFISLFVFALTGFSQNIIRQKQMQIDVSNKISKELKEASVDANIDKMTGDLQIPAIELFELNSYILKDEGKKLLDKVAPIYIDTIFADEELAGQIENIVIQGHTDSQMFAGVSSKDEQFLKNMDLSLKRANAVAEYVFRTNYNKKFADSFRSKLIVEGQSYNKPVLINGKEDFAKSRRVELKLKVKKWDVSTALGLERE
ncbi:OmpA family protein [bacterium]|nr:OmpA family protein [bacterium]